MLNLITDITEWYLGPRWLLNQCIKPSWLHISQPLSPPPNWMCSVMRKGEDISMIIQQDWGLMEFELLTQLSFKWYKVESDICRLIFGHYVGESWSVRPVESGIFKVVIYFCSPQCDHLFNISLPSCHIRRTDFSDSLSYWLRFWAVINAKR